MGHAHFSRQPWAGSRCSGWCIPVGTPWCLPPGWTTTSRPRTSASHCSCWCWQEHRRELCAAEGELWLLPCEETGVLLCWRAFWLTSFHEIELRAPIGALAVVGMLHVAGVLVWSCVQSDAVSPVGLQRLCLCRKRTKISPILWLDLSETANMCGKKCF